jgi:hypothetical protein
MDDYDSYDLQKVLKSLNEGILLNRPDLVEKGSEEFSAILRKIWNDKTIPKRIDCLKIGLPVSMAAIGYAAAGLQGAGAGFLAELGLKVGEKAFEELFGVKGETLLEKVAKFRTKSYQATVYDFKKKYPRRIKSA